MDAPTQHGFDHHVVLAAVKQPQDPHQSRLRLDRDHARAEAAEARDAVADMRADIEGEIAGMDELAIEPVHRRAARRGRRNRCAASGERRARFESRSNMVRPAAARRRRAPARASAGGASRSSGRPHNPMRAMASPSCGDEVTIASGIESASPAAMKDAIGMAAGCVAARIDERRSRRAMSAARSSRWRRASGTE